jgi:membrane fusion protein (multidrug efflux system)
MKKRSVAVIIIGIVVLAVVALAIVRIAARRTGTGARRQNVPLVRTEKPSRDTVSYTLQSTGDVVSIQRANIVAKVGGSLERVLVNIGAQVGQNQLLALIDTSELAQQVQQTGATLFTAQSNFSRARQLLADSLATQQDYENAEAAQKVAEANYQIAATHLSYAHITAPFSGTITARLLDPGAVVMPNASTLFTLMDLDSVKVVINVLEKDVPFVAIGARAMVTADALPADTLAGRVGRLSQAVDPTTRTMPVEVFVPNREHRLKPGMYATVSLVLSEHPDAITIPAQTVLTDANGTFVYAVVNDTARRLTVQPGITQGSQTEIISGLAGDEDLITTGQQFVRNGAPVSIQAATGKPQ